MSKPNPSSNPKIIIITNQKPHTWSTKRQSNNCSHIPVHSTLYVKLNKNFAFFSALYFANQHSLTLIPPIILTVTNRRNKWAALLYSCNFNTPVNSDGIFHIFFQMSRLFFFFFVFLVSHLFSLPHQ